MENSLVVLLLLDKKEEMQISMKLYFNTLCACTSSAWGIFSKILHNIHIEAVT
jgi:hypothetical protein